MKIKASAIAILLALAVQAVNAANITVTNDIVSSETWYTTNVYSMTKQIFVRPGATLTIQPGTVCKSDQGSLAVSRGGKIYVNGTRKNPVIMTSTNDNLTTWHEGCNEWGNLTIMGKALISASSDSLRSRPGNTKTPTGLNVVAMEGLTADGTNDVIYGGSDDNDDSGSIHYLSLRYGGKVLGLGNELNGLSMGGIGRATDVDHIEIMNNVDDGIETWGGTVNYKYVSIWNIGDDSMDIDQGWRGKAQFGLIVQGYSVNAGQGSGVGDNAIETDGAEDSDAQPVTTAAIYNFTVIGQPVDGDHGTAWRDNARIQYGNCIWMDLGEVLVKNDNVDTDGAQGYGYNGTLSWADTWTTDFSVYSTVNAGTWTNGGFNDPAVMYTAQGPGKLAQIKDSVFYNNNFATAYTEASNRNVFASGNSNTIATLSPIVRVQRAAAVVKGGKTMLQVTNINPCAANDAVVSAATAPNDGFFTQAPFRGGFSANYNWLADWTAAAAYKMTDVSMNPKEILVTNDIVTSTTWYSTNVYNMTKQIFVRPGATLTIQPGTVCQSDQGSLAVSRGGKIYVNGAKYNPVIMTSINDDLAQWHEGCNEWGNLTIMGKALISASSDSLRSRPGNTKTPTGLNVVAMEGLTADGTNDVIYGGSDDNDDSGSIHYLSLRYGGKVLGLGNELNGLSMGGIGRATDVDHIEIMNNVDDGIETWGGTVNYKYVNIWNIGDDSMDIDQGWRGKAQFGLIVQGYSVNAGQGSGVGDNCFEADGAEDSDAQPVTTAAIYNFTVIGQPVDGDHGTAWRDNARIQYGNCIWMDLGEVLVKNDNVDTDGAQGYGYNGTLSWANTWTTDFSVYSTVNAGTWTNGGFNDPAVMYTAQGPGKLAQIKDSVFYNNLFASAYTEADARGVRTGNNNVTASSSPVVLVQRAAPVVKGGKTMLQVTNINPCAANDAVVSAATAPNDGFFTQAPFRGGFSATNDWLEGWTAVDAYGMTSGSSGGDVTGATIRVTSSSASLFFPTTAGVVYTVEETSDLQNQNWAPVATVTGNGSIMSVADLVDMVKTENFYRIIVQ